jgi:hypothetical protein
MAQVAEEVQVLLEVAHPEQILILPVQVEQEPLLLFPVRLSLMRAAVLAGTTLARRLLAVRAAAVRVVVQPRLL